MANQPNITPIVAPRVPFIDPATSLISREWYRFLLNLVTRVDAGTEAADITPDNGSAIATLTELLAGVINGAQGTPPGATVEQFFTLQSQVDGLGLMPPPDQTVYAPLNSPQFTGQVKIDDPNYYLTVSAGSAYLNFDTNDYVSYDRTDNQLNVVINSAGIASFSATGAVLFGSPTATTATPGDSTNRIATTAFVSAAFAAGVTSFNTRTGAVTLSSGDVTGALGFTPQPTANPTFTGQLSVDDAQFYLVISGGDPFLNFDTNDYISFTRAANTLNFTINSTTVATATPSGFAFLQVPSAPTASPGTNTTQLANTAFVTAAVAAATSGVSSFNTRTGAVTLSSGDVTGALGFTPANASAVVSSFNTRTGTVSLTSSDVTGALTYTPLNKAGDTMGGQLNIEDATYFLHISSGNPTVNFDTNDYLQYDRSGNVLKAVVGTTSIFSASATALRADLRLEIVDADFYQTVSGGDAIINFDPTDYLEFDRAGNTFYFQSGGVTLAFLNTAGFHTANLVECGALQINQTPTATVTVSDYSIPVNINGTTMYMRLSSTP